MPSWLKGSPSKRSAPPNGLCEEERRRAQEVGTSGEILGMFRKGTMLLDEVDLLLDPMRSELNWPLGRRLPLDFAGAEGLRFRLPFHLLDAVFVAATGCPETSKLSERADGQATLGALAERVKVYYYYYCYYCYYYYY